MMWHPCSQMKDYETFKPIPLKGAKGSYLYLNNNKKIIDAMSSWWCKSLGHGHPRLKKALRQQMDKFEHVILANTTNKTIENLSKKLTSLMPTLDKIFYASEGASAVEIALKMSIHARQIEGKTNKNKFIALKNGYHGETIGALSVSDTGLYKEPYKDLLFQTYFIDPHLPWDITEKTLSDFASSATAVIVEPLIQGAGGMKLYSIDFLKNLHAWTKKHDIHFIADEIVTGLGRTGKMLACEHANIIPDFMCLGKSLSAGWIPMSAVLTTQNIYDLFYDDYHKGKSFLHSHTFSGNPLGASVAVEALNIIEEEKLCDRANDLGFHMQKAMQNIARKTGRLENIRSIGAICAADLISEDPKRRMGYEIYQKAVALGAFLRPIGNTVYWFPPLNMSLKTLDELQTITQRAISLTT